jgi:hypothetical protein
MNTLVVGLTIASITTVIMFVFLIENILIWTKRINKSHKKTNLSKNKPPYY